MRENALGCAGGHSSPEGDQIMTATANTMLLVWRLREARRLRETILGRQERLRGSLPQWALAPLRLVG